MVATINATAPAARKRTAKPKPAAAPTPTEETPEPGVVLFEKDGRTWRSTADRSFGAALLYLRSVRRGNSFDAEVGLLERLLGPKETDELLAAIASRGEWRQVVGRAVDYHLGAPEPEEPEGN